MGWGAGAVAGGSGAGDQDGVAWAVFYRGVRPGGWEAFRIFKFRTMVMNAEALEVLRRRKMTGVTLVGRFCEGQLRIAATAECAARGDESVGRGRK